MISSSALKAPVQFVLRYDSNHCVVQHMTAWRPVLVHEIVPGSQFLLIAFKAELRAES